MKRFTVYLLDGRQITIHAQDIKTDDDDGGAAISFWNGHRRIAAFVSFAGWDWHQD